MGYPIPVAAEELYGPTGTTKRHEIGGVGEFRDSNGYPIFARYMLNDSGASIAAGVAVLHGGRPGEIAGANVANSSPVWMVAGGLAASVASNGYGWVIFWGQQTNASVATSLASSSGDRYVAFNGPAVKSTAATLASLVSFASNTTVNVVNDIDHYCGVMRASDAWSTTGAIATIYWIWR
jgi:hypothetical protein